MPSEYRIGTGRYIDWARLMRDAKKQARRNPGAWWLALPDEPQRLVTTIRQRSHPDLRDADGVLEARAELAAPTLSGQRRANVLVRYSRTPDTHKLSRSSGQEDETHGEPGRQGRADDGAVQE